MRSERALILGRPDDNAHHLFDVLTELNPFLPVSRPADLPRLDDIGALFSCDDVSLVFLDADNLESACNYAREIRRLSHSTYIVAYRYHAAGDDLLSLLRAGVREWIPTPIQAASLREVLSRVRREQHEVPRTQRSGHLISFLPAKPGSGASTFALHFASELGLQMNARPALLDFDLNCGMQGFFLRLHGAHTLAHAATFGNRLDGVTWEKLISQTPELDVLPSGLPTPGTRLDPTQFLHVLAVAMQRNNAVCVDHSGNWERYSVDTLERSDLIYLVCSADLASLHRARHNLDLLRELDLGQRTRLVLNRAVWSHGITRQLVKEILGGEPGFELPNAFSSLQKALADGTLAKAGCPYRSAVRKLVRNTLDNSPELRRHSAPAESWFTTALTALRRRAIA
jgi:pilus assembly protein CpaE